jgi:hypothetical protein
MAREPGEIEIDDLSDDELQQLVVERLEEESGLDTGWLDVRVKDGVVTVAGQVGTDAEKQIAAQLVSERLGAEHFVDEIVVSELHRQELPDSIEDAADAERQIDDQLGGDDRRQSDTASHLEEDLGSETFGTHDPQKAVREGATYVPPDRPVGDGYDSAEDH